MAEVAHLERVCVAFGDRPVLQDVSLTIPANRATVIVGPSGSGKTTLLRCLNRLNDLYPDHRFDGSIQLTIDGEDVDVHAPGLDLAWLRRRVAMVFQSPNVLPMSVRRNLALPLRLVLGVRGEEAENRLEAALQRAGLWDEVSDRLGEDALRLSGGQQQRLCLARVLALDPAVLLLDEPTASLDFRAARKIEALIDSLEERYTIVAVSHSLGQAARIADHVVVLGEGQVLEQIEAADLEDAERFRRHVESLF
jgi:phosphate transport system ATP-binding protein